MHKILIYLILLLTFNTTFSVFAAGVAEGSGAAAMEGGSTAALSLHPVVSSEDLCRALKVAAEGSKEKGPEFVDTDPKGIWEGFRDFNEERERLEGLRHGRVPDCAMKIYVIEARSPGTGPADVGYLILDRPITLEGKLKNDAEEDDDGISDYESALSVEAAVAATSRRPEYYTEIISFVLPKYRGRGIGKGLRGLIIDMVHPAVGIPCLDGIFAGALSVVNGENTRQLHIAGKYGSLTFGPTVPPIIVPVVDNLGIKDVYFTYPPRRLPPTANPRFYAQMVDALRRGDKDKTLECWIRYVRSIASKRFR